MARTRQSWSKAVAADSRQGRMRDSSRPAIMQRLIFTGERQKSKCRMQKPVTRLRRQILFCLLPSTFCLCGSEPQRAGGGQGGGVGAGGPEGDAEPDVSLAVAREAAARFRGGHTRAGAGDVQRKDRA